MIAQFRKGLLQSEQNQLLITGAELSAATSKKHRKLLELSGVDMELLFFYDIAKVFSVYISLFLHIIIQWILTESTFMILQAKYYF